MLLGKKICALVPAIVGNKLNDKLIPLGRIANRTDYDGGLIFLYSNGSKYMTRHNLVANGERMIIFKIKI